MKYLKTILTILFGGPCALAAGFLVASPSGHPLHTAVRQGVVKVADVLTDGLSDTLSAFVGQWAVAAVVFLLAAVVTALMYWYYRDSRLFRFSGVLISLIPLIVAFLSGQWLLAVTAVIGAVFTVLCFLAYDKLTKVMPSVFNRETVSYIVFGVLTTVVSFVSQMVFASLGLPVFVNTVGSWVCAVTFAYVVNKLFVFESHTDTAKAFLRELWLFFAARLVSLGLELAFMMITVEWLQFNEAVCKLIAQIFILVANYIFSKLVIFKKKAE